MSRSISTALVGAVFLGFSSLAMFTQRLPGRAGLTSLTRESRPVVFWAFVVVFAFAGAALVVYGIWGRVVGENQSGQVRLPMAAMYMRLAVLFIAFAGLVGSIGWIVIEELMRSGGR